MKTVAERKIWRNMKEFLNMKNLCMYSLRYSNNSSYITPLGFQIMSQCFLRDSSYVWKGYSAINSVYSFIFNFV